VAAILGFSDDHLPALIPTATLLAWFIADSCSYCCHRGRGVKLFPLAKQAALHRPRAVLHSMPV